MDHGFGRPKTRVSGWNWEVAVTETVVYPPEVEVVELMLGCGLRSLASSRAAVWMPEVLVLLAVLVLP
jgi:hypothetical protein